MKATTMLIAASIVALAGVAATPSVTADNYLTQVVNCGVDNVDCIVFEGEDDDESCPLMTAPDEALKLASAHENCYTGS